MPYHRYQGDPSTGARAETRHRWHQENDQNKDHSIICVIAQAHSIRTQLEKGSVRSIKEYAKLYNIDQSDTKKLVALSYLGPSIIEDILAGHQPADLTARKLKDKAY